MTFGLTVNAGKYDQLTLHGVEESSIGAITKYLNEHAEVAQIVLVKETLDVPPLDEKDDDF